MSALLCLATVPVVLFDEGAMSTRRAATPAAHVVGDTSETLSYTSELLTWLRSAPRRAWLVLLVIYKTGEALATGMLRPFLVDSGMSLTDIGALLGTLGFTLGLLGALAGGALVQRLGRRTSLVLFGILQSVAIFALALAASRGQSLEIAAVCAFEHLTSGMATAALFTAMMDASRPERSATDYTLQACAVVVATGGAAALSGALAKQVGYPTHFAIAAVLSLGGALVALRAQAPDTASSNAALSIPQGREADLNPRV
jgi:predicted MFS family arabinose efflux permease